MRRDLSPKVVPLADAATILVSADVADGATLAVTLGGNRTLGNPSGTPRDGQRFMLRARQDGTGSRTLAYGSAYRFSTSIPSPTLTTAINATDRLGFEYHAADAVWDCIGVSKGYA